jgi:hypothetical protein
MHQDPIKDMKVIFDWINERGHAGLEFKDALTFIREGITVKLSDFIDR